MKTALILRMGAYGDGIILTPTVRALKSQGYKVIGEFGERCRAVFKNNPNIDEIIPYKDDSLKPTEVDTYWEKQVKKYKPDYEKNFCESIEVNVAAYPRSTAYTLPRYDREKVYNRNYYEATYDFAELEHGSYTPELFFTDEELKEANSHLKTGFNVLVCLTGSGMNKLYPWMPHVINELAKNPVFNIITVGDINCVPIEEIISDRVTKLSGLVPMRTSMALTKVCNLVIAPDTGILHAAGCFSTPKIGLLGHTSITNITKHFKNDYSIQANVPCAPCYRLIYDFKIQCPIDLETNASYCMGKGIDPQLVVKRTMEVYEKYMSDLRKVSSLCL